MTTRTRTAVPRAGAPALLAALAALSGCPLPQALPDYPTTGAIAPPRILADQVTPGATVLEVAPDCPGDPTFTLTARSFYDDTTKPFEARWFVDYDPTRPLQARDQDREPIAAPDNGTDQERPITPWAFRPYGYDPGVDAAARLAYRTGGGLHVVELVVSNGFAADPGPPEKPYRGTEEKFETQVYRWTFHYAPGGACGFPVALP